MPLARSPAEILERTPRTRSAARPVCARNASDRNMAARFRIVINFSSLRLWCWDAETPGQVLFARELHCHSAKRTGETYGEIQQEGVEEGRAGHARAEARETPLR